RAPRPRRGARLRLPRPRRHPRQGRLRRVRGPARPVPNLALLAQRRQVAPDLAVGQAHLPRDRQGAVLHRPAGADHPRLLRHLTTTRGDAPAMSERVPHWLAAAARPEVAAALDGLYADVAREIAARGPVCWASGRCCNFDRAGHRLYATGLEAASTFARLAAPARSSQGASLPVLPSPPSPRPLTRASLDDA